MGLFENEVYHGALWWNQLQTFVKLKPYLVRMHRSVTERKGATLNKNAHKL